MTAFNLYALDVHVETFLDDPHAEITVSSAWYGEETAEAAWNADPHAEVFTYIGGLLTRLAAQLDDDLRVTSVLHGCRNEPWLAHAVDMRGEPRYESKRRLRRGDQVASYESASVFPPTVCGACILHFTGGSFPSPPDCVSVAVPVKQRAEWAQKVRERLDELLAYEARRRA